MSASEPERAPEDAAETGERVSRTSGAFGQAGAIAATAPRPLRERIADVLRRPIEDPNPILLKELRATFRTALFIRFLYLSTGAVGLFVLALGASWASGEMPPAQVGQLLFHVFFSTVVFVLSMVAPTYAAASITGEKRSGTFESLILSGMSPARIVWGKFAAGYASIVLVVIAISPVVGMAFLFGGVSPFAVLTGFAWVLMWLAPAVAFGIAISARVESMWVAIVASFGLYTVACMFVWPIVIGLGEIAHAQWHTAEGAFWFAEAFPARIDTWDGWAFLVALPIYVLGMTTWLFIASAIAGVQPPAEDRSTPLKIWSVAAIAGMGATALVVGSTVGTHDLIAFGVSASIASGTMVLFVALLLANEPPLPPRGWLDGSLRRRVLSVIGPGAAGTLRFSFLAVIAASAVVPLTLGVVRWARVPAPSQAAFAFEAALLAIAIGNAAVGCFIAALATSIRLMTRNGATARVLAGAIFGMLAIFPFLAALIVDPSSVESIDRQVPLLLMGSPLLPVILAIGIALEHHMSGWDALRVLVTVVAYGGLALAMWIGVEARCARARRALAEKRKRNAEQGFVPVPDPAPEGGEPPPSP